MKTLQQWYNENQIDYSDKQTLNKMGVGDYDYHSLQDLNQMVRCENWARTRDSIKDEITNSIRKITFFTPTFNDSKPDASNYSCALVEDSSYQDWVISYRPSYTDDDFIYGDIIVKKTYDINEAENNLNGHHPVLAVAPSYGKFSDTYSFIKSCSLPSGVWDNPDRYLLPLDIIKIKGMVTHFCVYLGDGWICNYTKEEGTSFDVLRKSNKSSSSSSSSNSSSGGSNNNIYREHPKIPFKRKDEIIRHMAKAINSEYGKSGKVWQLGQRLSGFFGDDGYSWSYRNCEHATNRFIYGINISTQVDSSRSFNLRDEIWNTGDSHIVPFDSLTSSDCSYEKNRISNYIQQAENNRTYSRPKHEIEQEKFTARIEVRPNPPCKIQ